MKNEIYIMGSKKLHNESLANLLNRETAIKCSAVPDAFQFPLVEEGRSVLVLIDCPPKDLEKTVAGLEKTKMLTALFNVIPEKGIEEKAVVLGIRGIFYIQDSLEQFRKGIRAILNGELWMSRDIMARCLVTRKDRNNGMRGDVSILTQRELEILSIVVGGATNEEIANKLYISPHTVKTHIYNIFKKINVPNRLQAALWVSKNL